MIETIENLLMFKRMSNQMIELAEKYAYARYKQSGTVYLTESDSYLNTISFKIEWETGGWGCYETQSIDFEIPIAYFTDDDWEKQLQLEIDEHDRKEQERKEQAELQYKKTNEDREHEEYLRLKRKFEEETTKTPILFKK